MNISSKFNNLRVRELNYKFDSTVDKSTNEIIVNAHFSPIFNPKYPKTFYLRFEVSFSTKSDEISLHLVAFANFILDNDYDDTFMNSDYIRFQAAEIAFPYIKTFLAILTQTAGFNPIIIPDISFKDNTGFNYKEGTL